MKKKLLALFALTVLVTAATAYQAFRYKRIAIDSQLALAKAKTNLSLEQFSGQIVRRDAGLPLFGKLNERDAILAIRDYIYRSLEPGPDVTPNASDSTKYAVLGTDKNVMACGGASQAFAYALRSVGIQARTVQLAGQGYISGTDYKQTHVTVEVKQNGKWEISDPLYNMSLRCGDASERLSIPKAFECLASGKHFAPIYGRSQKPPLVFSNVRDRYESYYGAYIRFPSQAGEPLEEFPKSGWLALAVKAYD
jgi:hypothetical protein